jgi:hypothetical protein
MTTTTPDKPCPFCSLDATPVRAENAAAVAIADAFPVAEGHTLVVPKRHITSIFDLTDDAEAAARKARRGLWADPNPVAPWQWRAEKRGK